MTAKQTPTRRPVRGIKRMLLTMLSVTFFGWVLLFSWVMCLWVSQGFEAAANAVNRVTRMHVQTLSEFEGALRVSRLPISVPSTLKQDGDRLKQHAQRTTQQLKNEVVQQWQTHVDSREATDMAGLGDALSRAQLHASQCWYLMGATGRALLAKLVIVGASIPLFLWAMVAGLVDGLNQRAIRTACLGRESTYVFHKSMPWVRKLLVLVLGVWLSVPMVLSPSVVFVCLAVMVCFATSVSASRFKKYL